MGEASVNFDWVLFLALFRCLATTVSLLCACFGDKVAYDLVVYLIGITELYCAATTVVEHWICSRIRFSLCINEALSLSGSKPYLNEMLSC